MCQQRATQLLAGLEAAFQLDKSLDGLSRDRIRQPDNARLSDSGVRHERALQLERAHEVSGRLDDIVGTADEPEIAVPVAPGQIAGKVPAVHKAGPILFFVTEVTPE